MQSEVARPFVVSLADARAARTADKQRDAGDARSLAAHWQVYQAHGCLLGLSPNTREDYSTVMRHVLGVNAAGIDTGEGLPSEPTTGQVEAWVMALHTVDGYAQNYARHHLEVMKTVTRQASRITHDHVTADTIGAAKCRWKAQPPRARCPPRDLMVRTLPHVRNPAERCFLRLVGYAGLRVGEVRGLQFRDWDRRAHTLNIERQLEHDTRKNKSRHVVRLTEALEHDLMWTITHRDELRPKLGPQKRKTDGYVFPWGKSYVDGFLGRLRKALGPLSALYLPPGDAWHVYRHWGASELAHAGESLTAIMAFLGDASHHVAKAYIDTVRGTTEGVAMERLERMSREAAQLALCNLTDTNNRPEMTLSASKTHGVRSGHSQTDLSL